jgi:hypothetical protein
VIGDNDLAHVSIVKTPDKPEGNSAEDYFDPNQPFFSGGDRFLVHVEDLLCISTATRIIADVGHDT